MTSPPADALHRRRMQSLLESGQFSDVTLVVAGGPPEKKEQQKEFKVHRAQLSAFSPVFSAMFSRKDTKEALEKRVVIEDVSAETMHRLLTFIYTGELKLDDKGKEASLIELLAAVDKVLCNFPTGNFSVINTFLCVLSMRWTRSKPSVRTCWAAWSPSNGCAPFSSPLICTMRPTSKTVASTLWSATLLWSSLAAAKLGCSLKLPPAPS